MSDLRSRIPARRGITLVELLVVIGIMLILASITIPAMRPLTEGRRIREAARAINVYFGRARSRAIESGRPHGVMLERLDRQPQASVVLRQVEVPPPYGGEMLNAAVRVQDWTYTNDNNWHSSDSEYWLLEGQNTVHTYWPYGPRMLKVMVRADSPAGNYALDFATGLIRRGDFMRLNDQGPWYTIVDDTDDAPTGTDLPADFGSTLPTDFPVETDPASPNFGYIKFDLSGMPTTQDAFGNNWITSHVLTLRLDANTNYRSPFPERRDGASILSDPVRFQILRQPVPSAGAPLELSRGAVVDLGGSGTDRSADAFAPVDADADATNGIQDTSPVVVLFGPNGGVDRVIFQGTQSRVIDPIHLLVGTWDHVPASPVTSGMDTFSAGSRAPNPDVDDGLYNWEDQRNLWVAINPQTGLVTVAELYADYVDPTNTYLPSGVDKWSQIVVARKFAREAQVSKGGR